MNMPKFINRGRTGFPVVIFTLVYIFSASIFYSLPVFASTELESNNSQFNTPQNRSGNEVLDLPVISISDSTLEREITGKDILYYSDSVEDLQIQDLISRPLKWISGDGGTISFGFSKTPYWFRLRVENTSEKVQKRILEIANPVLDFVSIYTVKNNEVLNAQTAGDNLPFNVREIKHRNFLYSFSIEPNDYVDMYVAVRSEGSLQAPMTIWEENNFYLQDQAKQLMQGVFYGSLILMLVYNFFLFISLRERSYFIYVIFVVSALLSQASVRGDTFQYLWPENAWLFNKSAGFFTIAMIATGYAFMIEFLRLKKKAPRAYKFLLSMEVFFVILLIAILFAPYYIVMPLASYASIPVNVIALYIAIKLSFQHDRTAQYFTLAWMSFSVGFLIFVLSKVGVLPRAF